MPTVHLKGQGNTTQEIASLLRRELSTNNGVSCELVDEVELGLGDNKTYVMVFEKYYARASNRLTLTIVVSSHGDTVLVDAIGSGGGQGAFFKCSWGSEEDFVEVVPYILDSFEEI